MQELKYPFFNPQCWIRPGFNAFGLFPFVSPKLIENIHEELSESIDWQQGQVSLFGNDFDEPRLTSWQGVVTYQYSGRKLGPSPWTPAIDELRFMLEACLHKWGIGTARGLNHCLLNCYRNGQDGMGWHRDDEASLGLNPVICSVSFGAKRRFAVRPRLDPKRSEWLVFELGEGDLLVMCGETQTHWEHALLKTKKMIGPRFNLTFRSVMG
ncbi:alpha-ketoglutarate-dependent dioxygenase AlkB [Litorivicinus sp.]|nr:alpha-ketoglutarate-dependent dioxygenase AlkB [Litorivicinus sp.]MDC1240083.1 alpha-ketoglutarate-dependent dioxygenase AlkB [Litorivicinus sp.]